MTSLLKINHFATAANQAYHSSTPKYLSIDLKKPEAFSVQGLDIPYSFSEEAQKANKETWKIFRTSLLDTIGRNKFDWICHRYRNRINVSHLEKSSSPLLPEHVELFSVGSSQILSHDIGSKNGQKPSRGELAGKIAKTQALPLVGGYKDPLHIAGSPSTGLAFFFHDKLLMDKEKQLLFSDTGRLNFSSWLERMCKALVNRELIEGQLIPAVSLSGGVDYYKVYRKIGTGDGLVAYALQPAARDSNLKPLIVFRPTQWAISNEDAFASYCNDVQSNIGEMGWKAAEQIFRELMNDSNFRKKETKIMVAGYSLGGAHAQYCLAEHADDISHAVFYADPSVDDATAEKFAEVMNAKPRRREPLNIQIYRARSRSQIDFCHCVGGKHVGWGVTHPDVNIQLIDIDHENSEAHAFKLHAHRIFDNSQFPYRMKTHENSKYISDQLDNSKRGYVVFWYERMRRCFGTAAYYSFVSVSTVFKIFSAIFGIKMLRSSADPDC